MGRRDISASQGMLQRSGACLTVRAWKTSTTGNLVRRTAALLGCLLFPAVALCAPGWSIPDGLKTVEVNGYPMAYVEAGTGAPVVVIHGAWVDSRLFKGQVAEFSKSHRVIAVNLRRYYPEIWSGRGDDFSYRQHASDVAELIKKLNLGKVHLLGHSRGGGVAVVLALQNPDLLRTLLLAEPGGLQALLNDETLVRTYMGRVKGLSGMLRADLDAGEDRGAVAKKGWETASGPGAWDRMPESVRQMITDNIGTMAADMPVEVLAIGCDDIRKFSFPVLFLHGESTRKTYVDTIAAARACNPDVASTVVVPQARHNMHIDNPTFFNNAVLQFVQGK